MFRLQSTKFQFLTSGLSKRFLNYLVSEMDDFKTNIILCIDIAKGLQVGDLLLLLLLLSLFFIFSSA